MKFVFVPWHRAAILRHPWVGLWEALPKASMSGWGFELTILRIRVERSTTGPPTPLILFSFMNSASMAWRSSNVIVSWLALIWRNSSWHLLIVLLSHGMILRCTILGRVFSWSCVEKRWEIWEEASFPHWFIGVCVLKLSEEKELIFGLEEHAPACFWQRTWVTPFSSFKH